MTETQKRKEKRELKDGLTETQELEEGDESHENIKDHTRRARRG